ncbi:MAG: NAD(P)-binding domain-containing protein [Pyrinomonadaceae bacterium]
MRFVNIIFGIGLLVALTFVSGALSPRGTAVGGLTWPGWLALLSAIGATAVLFLAFDRRWSRRSLKRVDGDERRPVRVLDREELAELGLTKYRGPEYPHPVIFPDRCIGCHACVDACPHDVLAIVDGRARAVAPDLCMEDTACQAECPVNPKACIVVNTTKEVRSIPAPVRDGATFESNVAGCYIVGDVSGVPLIKNAVKEGSEVIRHIAGELRAAASPDSVEYDVAIVGVGPGGASAAATAHELGLRYVAIEQEKVLSTIRAYPKGKYIFFKPDTREWTGGLDVTGLGLAASRQADDDGGGTRPLAADLRQKIDEAVRPAVEELRERLLRSVPAALRGRDAALLDRELTGEFRSRVVTALGRGAGADLAASFERSFMPRRDEMLAAFAAEIEARLRSLVPGDLRETILEHWTEALAERGVRVNEEESCRTIERLEGGDGFAVKTVRSSDNAERTYTARRVVIAVGLRGAPNKLRVPDEDMTVTVDPAVGPEPKVLYSLSNPAAYRDRDIVVVGGGNSAVEAAIDLAAVRVGQSIEPRPAGDGNRVTLLVRTMLAPTVKFGNKYLLYKCADSGLIDIRYGVAVKELREREVVLQDARSGRELDTIANDYVFALIGGERPDRFLKSIGIEIGGK